MLSNVPDTHFGDSAELSFLRTLLWLQQQDTRSLSRFMSQNRIVPLFGATEEQWREEHYVELVNGLWRLYNVGP